MTKKSDAPAIRFKGFSDAWEQRKFSELVQIERGGSPRPIDDFITDAPNGLNWIKIGDAPTQGNYITKTAEKIRPEGLSKTREVHPGDLILSNSMSFGKPYIMGIDGCIHDGWLLIRNTYGVFDLTFLCHLLGTPQMLSQYRSLAAGSTVNNLNKELVGNTVVTIPSITEQRVLGDYLEQLDNLITLHQRKFEKLTNVKKSMLEKMFPQNGSSYPEIRFKGFTDPWEQRKLGEIGSVSMCRRIFKEQTSETGDIPFYKIGTFGAEPDAFISRELFEEYKSKYPYPKKGDILISASGSIGRTVEFAGNNEYFQDSNIVWLSHDERLSNSFLKCFYSVVKWAGIEGSTIKRLYNDNILNTVICMPSVPEQEHIGLFFENLDNLITLHQRQPFLHSTPEISLTVQLIHPFYTSSWEQRKFEEIAVRSSVICSDDTLPRVEYEDIVSGAGRLNKDIYAKQSSKSGIAFHQGDVLYGKLRPYLQNWLLPTFDGLAVGDFWVLQPQNADSSFLYRLIQSRQFDEVANQSTGTKMPRADWKLVSKTVFSIPSNISEQAAIGTYFTALDSLITLHQRKGKAAVTGCSNDANNSKGVYCKARDFGYKCYKKVKSQQIRCLIAVFIFFV